MYEDEENDHEVTEANHICPLCQRECMRTDSLHPIITGSDLNTIIVYMHNACHRIASNEEVESAVLGLRYDLMLTEVSDDVIHSC